MPENKENPGLPKGVRRQRNGCYSITPRMPLGVVSAEKLAIIQHVVEVFQLEEIRVTAGQRLMIPNIPKERLQAVLETLGPMGDTCKQYVQTCPGAVTCRMGMRDSQTMGLELESFLNQFDLPAKVKSGVAGCSMCCAESYVRDIGLVGRKNGWTILFGGNAGKRVRKGDELARNVSDDKVLDILAKVLDFYRENAKAGERTARFVERVGIESIRRVMSKTEIQEQDGEKGHV